MRNVIKQVATERLIIKVIESERTQCCTLINIYIVQQKFSVKIRDQKIPLTHPSDALKFGSTVDPPSIIRIALFLG